MMKAAFLVAAWVLAAPPAQAHDGKSMAAAAHGDTKRNEWFDSLKQPDNPKTGCCNLKDCYQTQAKQLPDGRWMAVVWDATGVKWRLIPPNKVLKKPLSIDGEAYVCNNDGDAGGWKQPSYYYGGGMGAVTPKPYHTDPGAGFIYCFVPPIPGY